MRDKAHVPALEGTVPIRTGMPVYDAAQQRVGDLEEITQDAILVNGQRLPLTAVRHIDVDGIHLKHGVASNAPSEAGGQATVYPTARDADVQTAGGQVRVPVVEERLVPETRSVPVGDVKIHKYISTEDARIRQPVSHDEVEVERVPVNRTVDTAPQTRQEGDWLIVPVVQEELVVQKRFVVKEEVRIRKRTVTEERELGDKVRRERVEIEDPGNLVIERRTT